MSTMLPSPTTSPSRPSDYALNNVTNTPTKRRRESLDNDDEERDLDTPFKGPIAPLKLLTPPATGRRRTTLKDVPLMKRIKLSYDDVEDSDEDDSSSEEESDGEDSRPTRKPVVQNHYQAMTDMCMARPGGRFAQRYQPSTRPILNTFISCLKSDVYKCESVDDDMALTVPFSCSYSNESKTGGKPLLAVASEEGSIHILDASKRAPWDPAAPRTVYRPHNNAVFDISWAHDDGSLVTASADHSARITDVLTGEITHTLLGHSSTLKCAIWDPNHTQLLATGGRDGTICIWDLRVNGAEGDDGEQVLHPVIAIAAAHEDKAGKRKRSKAGPMTKSVTGLVYSTNHPFKVVSSGTFDGILNEWDIRLPKTRRKSTVSKPCKPKSCTPIQSTPIDPTSLGSSRRPRGITSLTLNPADQDTLYALSADSQIYTYSLSSVTAYQDGVDEPKVFTHPHMQTNSFFIKLAVSPCGKWLASGGTGASKAGITAASTAAGLPPQRGNLFLFDVAGPCRQGVELCSQAGDVNGIDWASEGALAACADDGTVKVWRPDLEIYAQCVDDPADNEYRYSWVR